MNFSSFKFRGLLEHHHQDYWLVFAADEVWHETGPVCQVLFIFMHGSWISLVEEEENKSPGSDGYKAEWYEELKEGVIPVILSTLIWVLKKAQILPRWKKAIVSFVLK